MEADLVNPLSKGLILASNIGKTIKFDFETTGPLDAHNMENMRNHLEGIKHFYADKIIPYLEIVQQVILGRLLLDNSRIGIIFFQHL